jgi:hypothetical protein
MWASLTCVFEKTIQNFIIRTKSSCCNVSVEMHKRYIYKWQLAYCNRNMGKRWWRRCINKVHCHDRVQDCTKQDGGRWLWEKVGSQKTSAYCKISLDFFSLSQSSWFRMHNRIAVQLGHHSRQCKCANSIIKVDENCSIEFEAEYNIVNSF